MTHKGEKFWDRVAGSVVKAGTKPSGTSLKTLENLDSYLQPADVVLDFGCGSGTFTTEMAKKVRLVQAIDISSRMLQVARESAKEQQMENISFSRTSIFDESFKGGSFDVIVAFNILHYLDDQQKLMQKVHHLLKSGGLFISATACLKERKSFVRYLMLLLSISGILPDMHFYSVSELKGLMETAHFEVVDCKNLTQLPECFIVAKKK